MEAGEVEVGIKVGDFVRLSEEGLRSLSFRSRRGMPPKDWRGEVFVVSCGLVRVLWEGQKYRETYSEVFLEVVGRCEE